MSRRNKLAWLALAALLGACGGGGGDSPAPPLQTPAASVAGLYFGTASGGRTFDALILDNGRIYGTLGAGTGISTVFFGSGTVTANGFTSSTGGNLTVNSGAPLVPGAVTLTGVPKTSITGTLTGTGSAFPATFDSTYSATFEGTPSLATVAGSYLGNSSGLGRVINLTLTVDASTGAIAGVSSDGCTHTGTLTPNASANVYDLSVAFGAGCPFRSTFTGHAIWRAAAGANPAALTAFAAVGSAATSPFAEGWIFVGGKQP